jgi:hypothetical protein
MILNARRSILWGAVALAQFSVASAAVVATPIFKPKAGTYAAAQSVTLSDATPGATIYYTTDGTTPTTSSTPYTAPIAVKKTDTLKAIAAAKGDSNSAVVTAAYTILTPTATPVLSPKPAIYTLPQKVSISDATKGAAIYYTTDGTTPTTASTKYTTPINVAVTETIEAIALASGHSRSVVARAKYTLKVGTPVFSPAAGKYTKAQSVTITELSPGATIYYTTNGTTPTTASTRYTAAIPVGKTVTIKAIGVATGQTESAVASAVYTIDTAKVPNVVADTQAQATTAIKAADLIVGKVTTKSSTTVAAGLVISETPVAGTPVASGSAVNLVLSSGAGSLNGAFWVPFTEQPANSAIIKIGALPSNLARDTFTAVPTAGHVTVLAQIYSYTFTQGILTAATPYAALFAGLGGDGNLHVYSAQLSNAAHAPAAAQVSSFSVPATDVVCNLNYGYASLVDPTSAFLILTVGTAAHGCSATLGTSYLVQLKDSATTAPTLLTGVQGGLDSAELFTSGGTIAGIVAFDSSQNLNFYPAAGGLPSFSSPIRIAADVTDNGFDTVGLTRGGHLLAGGSQTFFNVTTAGGSGQNEVLRILANGQASVVYTLPSGAPAGPNLDYIYDNANYYFTVPSTDGTQATIAVSLTTGASRTLNSNSPDLIDSDGTHLIYTGGSSSGAELLTLPVGGGSLLTRIAGGSGTQEVSAYLDFASGQIFVNLIGATSISGEVVTGAGVVKSGPTVGTEYLPTELFDFGSGVGHTILQLDGVADANSMAGASLYVTDISTLTSTAITLDGAPYVVPASTLLSGEQEGTTLIQGVGTNTTSNSNFGFLIDTSKHEIVETPSTTAGLGFFY